VSLHHDAAVPAWLTELVPIALLLGAIAFVVARLPRVDLGYSPAFVRRRRANWLVLGLTYSFLYMGRYNLNAATSALGGSLTNRDFGDIFGLGTLVYGCAFIVNGPLTDRLGGRTTILIAAAGSALCNLGMGAVLRLGWTHHLATTYSVLYAANMYFQSFGAVSIVKVNAHWFHVRERGTFGGLFGILISLGLYFAFDWSRVVIRALGVEWAFFAPAIVLLVFFVLDWLVVFDRPGDTGHPDVETEEAALSAAAEQPSLLEVARRLVTHPVLVTVALVEFCSGYFRQSVMQWAPKFAKQTGLQSEFVHAHWGWMLCVAGILGGMTAGAVSDHVFGSRRGPSTLLLYSLMLACTIAATFSLDSPVLGWLLVVMSMSIIGVHGLLSGTASMDFAGKRNTGLAVGIIDGCVYLGTALQSVVLGRWLPQESSPEAADPAHWRIWPVLILPAAVAGLLLSTRLWSARPVPRSARDGGR
jgi:MFS transporter, OPA family, glycerol-3-phosphate transporter